MNKNGLDAVAIDRGERDSEEGDLSTHEITTEKLHLEPNRLVAWIFSQAGLTFLATVAQWAEQRFCKPWGQSCLRQTEETCPDLETLAPVMAVAGAENSAPRRLPLSCRFLLALAMTCV